MATSHGDRAPPEPRYTIEQISLLHRLLRTGLTKADIVHALDSMSKMDAELQATTMPLLGSAGGGHSSTGQSLTGHSSAGHQSAGHQSAGHQSASHQSASHQSAGYQSAGHLLTGHSSAGHSSAGHQSTGHSSPGTSQYGAVARRSAAGTRQSGNGKDLRLDPSAEQGSPSAILQPSVSPEVTCGVENFQDITDEELETLFQRGPMAVKSEIRLFMTKHRLSQSQISMATGISQSYISAFLIHGFKMRRSTQALLYRWYLGKRRELEGLDDSPELEPLDNGPAVSLANRCVEVVQSYQSMASHNFLPAFKRRERFIWRESHVRIMESYYNKNPYPNDFEREKITEACNSEMQQSGESIPDNKWVTSSKVYNWFANRRKDCNRRKRLSQRMGLETTETDQTAGGGDFVAREDHTHYTSAGPQHLQVIEVRHEALSGGEEEEVVLESIEAMADPSQQQVTATEEGQEVQVLCMSGAAALGGRNGDQTHGQTAGRLAEAKPVDAKPYEGASTIYTLIEASHESDARKGSQ